MVFSEYTKTRILFYRDQGCRPLRIASLLHQEGISASGRGVALFIKRFDETRSIVRRPGSGLWTVISDDMKEVVEQEMQRDDETTAQQLHAILVRKGYSVSMSTILRCRRKLGWTFRGSAYCQMIRAVNKTKRLEWARAYAHEAESGFLDVIFTDETSIQLESHRRFCCRKAGQPPRPKPRAKHPVKVHVWGGISLRGTTCLCVFEGKMDAVMYVDILQKSLKPFVEEVYPDSHRFMQDNDPKHTSRLANEFFQSSNINWWKTPPESPDTNPIENLWHELKEYLRREVKPKIKQELIDGIQDFWRTVTVAKCTKYIRHLRKVIPRVIELEGAATGY